MLLFFLQDDPNAWNGIIAKATIVIAVATVAYLFTTILLLWLTKRSVDLTKHMFETSHRPYIALGAFQKIVKESPPVIQFQVVAKNVGNVPAYEFVFDAFMIVEGVILQNVVREEIDVWVIFPGIDHQLGV